MEKITKAHIKSFQIPKIFMDHLNCDTNDLVRWEVNPQTNIVKLSCVKKSDYPHVKCTTSYNEKDIIVLYRSLYKQGSTVFPVFVRNFLAFEKGQMIRWITDEDKKVIIEKVERTRLADLSGIV